MVVSYLRAAGHAVWEAEDGDQALQALRGNPATDLIVLDLMLPGMDGLRLCRLIRERGSDVPIIMLTARGAETDRVIGLQHGADDYLTKPFSPLVLRVASVLRRAGEHASVDRAVVTDGDLVVDPARRAVTLAGRAVNVTGREFDLLHFAVAHPGMTFSREQLLREVWGWSFGDQSTVTVHVRRGREKSENDPTKPVRLVTVWGGGYRWEGAASGLVRAGTESRREEVGQ